MKKNFHAFFKWLGQISFISTVSILTIPNFYFGNEGIAITAGFFGGIMGMVWLICLIIRLLFNNDSNKIFSLVLFQLLLLLLVLLMLWIDFGNFEVGNIIFTIIIGVALILFFWDLKNAFKR